MMQHLARISVISTLFLSTACVTYSLEELRQTTPKGNAFQNALAKEYLAFASEEERQYDWWDSAYFADKGLRAAYGKEIGPEDLAVWNLSENRRAELAQARANLVPALDQYSAANPEVAARAQVYFDCWVEQSEENWQEDDIARCRDGMLDALEQLGVAVPAAGTPDLPLAETPDEPTMAEPLAETPVEAPAPAPASAPAEESAAPLPAEPAPPKKPMPHAGSAKNSHTVFFDKQGIEPAESGLRVIEEVLRSLESRADYEIVLSSHTDTQGDAKENLMISEKRAQAVKERLVAGGANADRIKTFAYGESDPPVKTKDEVDEPANRRVEIVLSE